MANTSSPAQGASALARSVQCTGAEGAPGRRLSDWRKASAATTNSTGTATSSYVTGYNVSAEYSGTVSRIALDRVRYVAIFERTTFVPEELPPEEIEDPTAPEPEAPAVPGELPESPEDSSPGFHFNWAFLLIPLAVVAVGGGGLGIALYLRRRSESREETH